MRKGYPIALKNGISGSIFRYRCNFQYVKNKKRQRIRILRQKKPNRKPERKPERKQNRKTKRKTKRKTNKKHIEKNMYTEGL